jgi:hypothetical protein
VNGKDSVITFNISETSAAEDEGLAIGSSTSRVFVFSKDSTTSFHFLGVSAFGSDAIFIFFKASSSSFTDRAACLLKMQTTPFIFAPRPLRQVCHNPGTLSSGHPFPYLTFVSAGCRRQQSLTDLLSLCNFQEFRYT